MSIERLLVVLLLLVLGAGCSARTPATPPATASAPAGPDSNGRTSDDVVLARTFASTGDTPFDQAGKPTPDGRRVLDVLALQGALVRYRLGHGQYPAALDPLAPEVMPVVPHDPVSGQAYGYRVLRDGADYELRTVLSNGQTFYGADHRTG